jgi:hypothetical protein
MDARSAVRHVVVVVVGLSAGCGARDDARVVWSDGDGAVLPDDSFPGVLSMDASAVLAGERDAAAPDAAAFAGTVEGVPAQATIAQLGDRDVEALCRHAEARSVSDAPSVEARCTFLAASSTSAQAECEAQREACLGFAQAPVPADCTGVRADGLDPSCGPIYVGEYDACLTASYAAARARVTQASCAAPRVSLEDASEPPDGCVRIALLCPALLP